MHQFPSNVAGTIVLFFLLMCSHMVLPKYTDRFVQLIDPYSTLALKSMNIMFVPPVVEIVNNSPTPGPEVVVGYFVGFILTTILVRLLRFLLYSHYDFLKHTITSSKEKTTEVDPKLSEEAVIINVPEDIRHKSKPSVSLPLNDAHDLPSGSSDSTIASFCVSAHHHSESVQLDQHSHTQSPKDKHGPLHYIAIWCMKESNFDDLTFFILFCFAAFVFLPLPEDNGAMPFFRLLLYFTMTILLFSLSCKLPVRLRLIFHPIIVTAAIVMAGIAYFERVKGFDIKHGADLYKSGVTFISLVEKTNVNWPGAGDILATTMDVSIISLAFNVYKSRPNELRQWLIIVASIVPVAFLIMFVTPMFAYAIGCSPADSIVWSSRSVTTAIGIVISRVLGSNQSIVTCIIIFTGITGPILGPTLLKLARVKDDDYMTIGITMGSHSHGVGTAYLIGKNPRASGMSSIAFAIFGTTGVIVASIPALSDIIKRSSGF
ncbi:hypothetical protein G6F57_009591 [Rhizopus arrhizus]|uniref:LrgB-like protein n=1 Tax=Rhizopus oryzae TaxID=64495 RepID=A0A9P7BQR7_RHIOR|nr:hypothetical protein G6F30_008453 [Rhizopus arrhizus]KAG1419961.1 hypothetical protein G6F58_004381 [Rhizopus delemar]KAG0979293.1 hypothetical protein G6F29_008695 [Rhizopus arrhizus]KAG0992077.1 hypothetical protein G6F28_007986 [Rhizopus arrhizus]KAG1004134.1 hypothetical protein G6F27_010419 [Rhizopus arrhizus]